MYMSHLKLSNYINLLFCLYKSLKVFDKNKNEQKYSIQMCTKCISAKLHYRYIA